MPPSFSDDARPRVRPAIWRIVVWLVLLLAVFGILQYSVHAWQVATALHHAGGDGTGGAPLKAMLAWDIVYLVVACITVTASAGVLFRRTWARPLLRVVAGLLALWFLVTAIQMVAQWSSLNNQSTMLLSQSGINDAAHALLERLRRRYLVAMILKAVAVPVMVWLAWRLGTPAVCGQFPASPRRAKR